MLQYFIFSVYSGNLRFLFDVPISTQLGTIKNSKMNCQIPSSTEFLKYTIRKYWYYIAM